VAHRGFDTLTTTRRGHHLVQSNGLITVRVCALLRVPLQKMGLHDVILSQCCNIIGLCLWVKLWLVSNSNGILKLVLSVPGSPKMPVVYDVGTCKQPEAPAAVYILVACGWQGVRSVHRYVAYPNTFCIIGGSLHSCSTHLTRI
jgi:hypothetical protein